MLTNYMANFIPGDIKFAILAPKIQKYCITMTS